MLDPEETGDGSPKVVVENAEEYIQLRRVRSLLDVRDQARDALQFAQSQAYGNGSHGDVSGAVKSYLDAYVLEAKNIILESERAAVWDEEIITQISIPPGIENERLKYECWEIVGDDQLNVVTILDEIEHSMEKKGKDPSKARSQNKHTKLNLHSPSRVLIVGLQDFLRMPKSIIIRYHERNPYKYDGRSKSMERSISIPMSIMLEVKETVDDILDMSGLGIELHESTQGELFIDELRNGG
jgi:hypothetical protein